MGHAVFGDTDGLRGAAAHAPKAVVGVGEPHAGSQAVHHGRYFQQQTPQHGHSFHVALALKPRTQRDIGVARPHGGEQGRNLAVVMLPVGVEMNNVLGSLPEGIIHTCLQRGPLPEVDRVAQVVQAQVLNRGERIVGGAIIDNHHRIALVDQGQQRLAQGGGLVISGYHHKNGGVGQRHGYGGLASVGFLRLHYQR